MICKLCLKDIAEVIDIFGESGTLLNMAVVLAKYFWFEVSNQDPISKAVCNTCWIKVFSFHEFYVEVEEAHRRLATPFIATEDGHATKIEYGEERPPGVDSICDTVYKVKNDNSKQFRERSEVNPEVPLQEQVNNDDDRADSFDGTIFVEELPDNNMEFKTDREETDMLADTREEPQKRRSQRSCVRSNNVKTQQPPQKAKPPAIKEEDVSPGKKRRGRPPKTVHESKMLQKVVPEKMQSPTTVQKESKSREADTKIAQNMTLTCDICGQDQSTFALLRKHMVKVHHCKGYAVCCDKKFNKRALLLYHIEKHINPDVYRCDECDRVFADKQCMRNHFLLKHQPDEVKTFQCDHCPKKFAKWYLLEHHRIVHEERTHICQVCQKGFPTRSFLSAHIKVIHENYGTMCDICAKIIRGRSLFARHMLEHTGVPLPKVQCDKCGSWHKDKYSLQKHKRRHNDDGTVHVCNICGKVSPNRSAMLSHKRYVHAADRPFECGVCNKAFKKAINLKEHMTMHTGEVLYKCAHCAKTFNSNANMHSHRKKVHPKEFEETRKQRLENASKPASKKLSTTLTADPTGSTQCVDKVLAADTTIPQMITIQTPDDGKTHNIFVSTDDFGPDQLLERKRRSSSIVFTVP